MGQIARPVPSRRNLASSGMFFLSYEALVSDLDTNRSVCKGTSAMERLNARGSRPSIA